MEREYQELNSLEKGPLFLSELRQRSLTELYQLAEALGIENIYTFYKKPMLFTKLFRLYFLEMLKSL